MAGKFPTDFLDHGTGDRRSFFRATVGKVAREIGKHAERRVVQERYMRPPGAMEEVGFLATCTRCGDCLEVCPVGAIMKVPPSGGLAAGTPMINPVLQPCVVCDGMPCIKACPTESLSQPEDGWASVSMGRVELDPDRCIAFMGTACDACVRSCPIGESALSMDQGNRPVLKVEHCVGCGVCVRACVTSPSSMTIEY